MTTRPHFAVHDTSEEFGGFQTRGRDVSAELAAEGGQVDDAAPGSA